MNIRIKTVRTDAKMTQQEFSERLDLSRNFIAQMEMGSKLPSDRTIKDICRIFSVNEEWLRNGTGEMYIPKTKNEEIQEFANEVMCEMDETFRKRLVLALSKMTPEQWELLEEIIDNVKKQD